VNGRAENLSIGDNLHATEYPATSIHRLRPVWEGKVKLKRGQMSWDRGAERSERLSSE
jgi:hypothetical protein